MEKIYDVVIMGSGPAGLTAAIYAVRGAASTLVLGGEKWGGQLMDTTLVENFPGFLDGIQGPDLMKAMREQAERLGAEFLEKKVTAVNFKTQPFELKVGEETFKGRTVIIAAGAKNLWLGVSGEKELVGRGVSTCATCDAPFFKGKKVAVVGGGDTAMEDAATLTKFASEVTIIHRRDKFRAAPATQKKVVGHPKVKILWNTEITKINGQEKVESLSLKNNQTGKEENLVVDGVFIAIGHKPDSELFAGQVERDEGGYILPKNWHCGTTVKGVFVAGDVADKEFKQAVVSAGMGCMAAIEALKYLDEVGVDK